MPFYAGSICEFSHSDSSGNSVEDCEDFTVFNEISHSRVLKCLENLVVLAKYADDIFASLSNESENIAKRVENVQETCDSLSTRVCRLDHKMVEIPERDLSECQDDNTLGLFYQSHLVESGSLDLFTDRTRPLSLQQCYLNCADDEQITKHRYEKYQMEAEHLLASDMKDGCEKIPNLDLETRKPAIIEKLRQDQNIVWRRQSSEMMTFSDGGSDDALKVLPTPEEVVRRSLADSKLVSVDTSGVPFSRLCAYRQSLRSASLDSVLDPRPRNSQEAFELGLQDPRPIQRCRTLEFEQCRSSGYKTDDDSDLEFRISRDDYIGHYDVFDKNASQGALSRMKEGIRGSLRNLSCLSTRSNRDKWKSRSMPNVTPETKPRSLSVPAPSNAINADVREPIRCKIEAEVENSEEKPGLFRFHKLRRSKSMVSRKERNSKRLQRAQSQDLIDPQKMSTVNIDINEPDEGIAVSRDDVSQSGSKKRRSITRRLSQLWSNVQFRPGNKGTKKSERQSSSGHWTASSGDFRQSVGSAVSPESLKDSALDLRAPDRMSCAGSLADSVTDLTKPSTDVISPAPTSHDVTVEFLRHDVDALSEYSVDVDGFYTSMHTDSGLKKSRDSLDEPRIFQSTDSINSVINRLSVIRLSDEKSKPAPPKRSSSISQSSLEKVKMRKAKNSDELKRRSTGSCSTNSASIQRSMSTGSSYSRMSEQSSISLNSKLTDVSMTDTEIYARLKSKTRINSNLYPSIIQVTDVSDMESEVESNKMSAIPSPWSQFSSPYSTIERYKSVMQQEQKYDGSTEYRYRTLPNQKIAFREFATKKEERMDMNCNSLPRAPKLPPKPSYLRGFRNVRLGSMSSNSSHQPSSSVDTPRDSVSLTSSCSSLTPTNSPPSERKHEHKTGDIVNSKSLKQPDPGYANSSVIPPKLPPRKPRSLYANTNIYANVDNELQPKVERTVEVNHELIYASTDILNKIGVEMEGNKSDSEGSLKGTLTGIRLSTPDYACLKKSDTSSDDGTLTDRSNDSLNIPEGMQILSTFDHTLNAAKMSSATNRNRSFLSPNHTDSEITSNSESVSTFFDTTPCQSILPRPYKAPESRGASHVNGIDRRSSESKISETRAKIAELRRGSLPVTRSPDSYNSLPKNLPQRRLSNTSVGGKSDRSSSTLKTMTQSSSSSTLKAMKSCKETSPKTSNITQKSMASFNDPMTSASMTTPKSVTSFKDASTGVSSTDISSKPKLTSVNTDVKTVSSDSSSVTAPVSGCTLKLMTSSISGPTLKLVTNGDHKPVTSPSTVTTLTIPQKSMTSSTVPLKGVSSTSLPRKTVTSPPVTPIRFNFPSSKSSGAADISPSKVVTSVNSTSPTQTSPESSQTTAEMSQATSSPTSTTSSVSSPTIPSPMTSPAPTSSVARPTATLSMETPSTLSATSPTSPSATSYSPKDVAERKKQLQLAPLANFDEEMDDKVETSDDVNEDDVMEILDSIRTTIKGIKVDYDDVTSPDSGTSSLPLSPVTPCTPLTP